MISGTLNFWLHVIGGALGLLGVAFVGVRLHSHAGNLEFSASFGVWESLGFLVLAILYAASNVLLARAWWRQLDFFSMRTSWSWALNAYGISQIARYVPGNIFHLAGRQALGMAAGFPASSLAKSSAWELVSIVIVGVIYGVLAIPLLWHNIPYVIAPLVFCCMLIGMCAVVQRTVSRSTAEALLWQAGFLGLCGFIFFAVLALVMSSTISWTLAVPVCGAYVVAWLVGLVTPGAPAGVGVREVVLLSLLQSVVDSHVLLLAVVLSRAVTVLGDLFFYLFALFRDRKCGKFFC